MTGTGAQQLMQKKSSRDLKKRVAGSNPSANLNSVCWELGNRWIALTQNVKCVKNVSVVWRPKWRGLWRSAALLLLRGDFFAVASGQGIHVFSICRMSVSAYLNYKLYRRCLRHTKLSLSRRIVGINSLTVSQFLPWGKWEK